MDLTTTYLGLKLRTPLVPAASPLSEELDTIRQMEDADASAVVLITGTDASHADLRARAAKLPVFETTEDAVLAMYALAQYSKIRRWD